MTASLEQRLNAAESRAAIADLVHAYARHIRRDEPELVHLLFAPEGSFEVRDGQPDSADFTVRTHLASPARILAYMAPNKGKPHPVPLIHNLMIELDGDTATASSVMEAQVYGTTHKIIGEYRDSFVRVAGKWLFSARVYTIFKDAKPV